ncbi:hypothetical protein MTBBW1_310015 [Desulfamplus magnetovallimortis]|uniref:Uncharacterized protein n=1 Tax=Desulfamplus magnetovallimortis TaxID=1246637 RepID=A0A1W1HG68_9BACT|nr:hypothetical protein MTBBW1_310015 [Desulfamplus magnetovallimortis]
MKKATRCQFLEYNQAKIFLAVTSIDRQTSLLLGTKKKSPASAYYIQRNTFEYCSAGASSGAAKTNCKYCH